MHALRNAHRMLTADGTLVDLHPVLPNPRFLAEGRDLGPLHEEQWAREWLRPTERELERTVRMGLFEPKARIDFHVVHRYEDPEDAVADADEWDEGWISDRLRRRILRATPPIDLKERVVLRTYRAC